MYSETQMFMLYQICVHSFSVVAVGGVFTQKNQFYFHIDMKT